VRSNPWLARISPASSGRCFSFSDRCGCFSILFIPWRGCRSASTAVSQV
jgi:hypothetical protein